MIQITDNHNIEVTDNAISDTNAISDKLIIIKKSNITKKPKNDFIVTDLYHILKILFKKHKINKWDYKDSITKLHLQKPLKSNVNRHIFYFINHYLQNNKTTDNNNNRITINTLFGSYSVAIKKKYLIDYLKTLSALKIDAYHSEIQKEVTKQIERQQIIENKQIALCTL